VPPLLSSRFLSAPLSSVSQFRMGPPSGSTEGRRRENRGRGRRGELCGRRRLGIMYFIMISQQNCNLQRAMSYLLRARTFFACLFLSSFSLSPSLSLSLSLSLALSLSLFLPLIQLSVLSLTGLDREANC